VHCYFHITFDRLTAGRNITADRSPEHTHPTDSIQYAHVLWHLPSSSNQSQAGIEQGSDFLHSNPRPEHKQSDDAAVVHGPLMNNKDSTVRNTHFRTTNYFLLNVQTMHDVYSLDI
jgi:hypothetical protein